LYRFQNLGKNAPIDALVDRTLEPRLNQIFVPLLSVVGDPTIRAELRQIARERNREIVADRGMDVEAQVLEVIKDLAGQQSKMTVAEVTAAFIERYGREYDRPITNKWIGYLKQAAAVLKVSEATVRRLVKEKILPAIQHCKGAPWLIRACDLDDETIKRTADARRQRRPPSGDRRQNILAL
jgi:excisionase family DNA binding protein